MRRLPHQDAIDRCRGLQSSGRVHHVPGRHSLALVGSCSERDERLSGIDGDAHLEVRLLLDHPVTDRQRSPDGALGIVLVRDRRAEQRHDGVADELLDRPAVVFELGAEPRVERRQERADILGIEALGSRCESDQVGEENADDLALLAGRGRGGGHHGAAL